ncbi:Tyrosine recombinase XerC [termite gut metagenome]|uniref:Tyrosine recombinase XerC n=1 Tax=termite gut metagenome TaxID=433724 RepID=A0A5J4QMS5_9ZZZZ
MRSLLEIKHTNAYIMKSDYDKWREKISGHHPATIYREVSILARFLRYMCGLGHECYIPTLPKRPLKDFVPYIYSKDEMEKIFNVADALRMEQKCHQSIMMIMPALLRLLYSTGIRIGEALSIKNRDIDFNRHVIILNETKNGCQRLVPLNSTMDVVLKQYLLYRNRMPIAGLDNPDNPLFVSGIGKSPAQSTVYSNFHKIIKKAGILYKGGHKGPNIHGIRHTSCVHVMLKMIHKGKDMYCCLPVLSAFMGHKHVIDTEMYIHLTKEMYPELIKMDRSVTSSISKIIACALITENDYK